MTEFQLSPVKSDDEMLAEVLSFVKQSNFALEPHKESKAITTPSYKISLREKTSDFHVYGEIFMKEDYKSLIEQYKRQFKGHQPTTLIDVGANIGCASIYFKTHFPLASIYAIEAEISNFKQLEKNILLNNYQNVYCSHNAFWVNEEEITLDKSFRDGREWAFATRPKQDLDKETVKGITFANLLQKYNLERVNILKIDIEGAEKWILNDAETMKLIAQKVDFLLIEFHEDVITKDEASTILKNYNFHVHNESTLLFANILFK
jgi:FkbM family methyltransferase